MPEPVDSDKDWGKKLEGIDFSFLDKSGGLEDKRPVIYEEVRQALKPFEQVLHAESAKLLDPKSLPQSAKRTESRNGLEYSYNVADSSSGKELNIVVGFQKKGDQWVKDYFAVIHNSWFDGYQKESKGVFFFNEKGQIEMIRVEDPATGWGTSKLLDPIYDFLDLPGTITRPTTVDLILKSPSEMGIETSAPEHKASYPLRGNGRIPITNAKFEKIAVKAAESILPRGMVPAAT